MGFTRIRSVGGGDVAKRIVRTDEGLATESPEHFPYLWTHWDQEEWADPEHAARCLRETAASRKDAYIAGRLRTGLDPLGRHCRLRLDCTRTGREATVGSRPQTWVAVDLDDVVVAPGTPEQMLAEAIDRHLPVLYHETTCVYQWTSGYAIKNPAHHLRVRLFFQLEEPATMAQVRQSMKPAAKGVDRSIYQDQSVLYVADPELAEGVEDPCPQRVGILQREYDFVPPLPEAADEPEGVAPLASVPSDPPSQAEIDELVGIHTRSAEAGASRHNCGLSLTCELLGRGVPADQAAEICREWMVSQGRDPQPQEVTNWIGYWEDHRPSLRITTARQAFADDPPTAADEEGDPTRPPVVWDERIPATTALSWVERHYPPITDDRYRIVHVWGRPYAYDEAHGWGEKEEGWLANAILMTNRAVPVKLWRQMATHIEALTFFGRDGSWEMPFYLDGRQLRHDVLVLRNGLLHLRKGQPPEVTPHDPMLFIPSRGTFDYDAQATCPRWLKFLGETFPNATLDVIELQKFFGLLMERTSRRQKFAMLVGKSGAGKGVIGRIMTKFVGANMTVSPSLPDLGSDFGKQTLIGKRLALVNESTDGGRSNSIGGQVLDELKKLTGHDQVQINRKHLDYAQMTFEGKIVIAANTLPSFSEASDAIVRRMVPFRFRVQVDDDKRDETLDETLAAELPGILNWAVAGWKLLQEEGFRTTPNQREELVSLKALCDPMGNFVKDCITRGAPEDKLTASAMYHVYCEHAAAVGRGQLSQSKLFQQLVDKLEARPYLQGTSEAFVRGFAFTEHGQRLVTSTTAIRKVRN